MSWGSGHALEGVDQCIAAAGDAELEVLGSKLNHRVEPVELDLEAQLLLPPLEELTGAKSTEEGCARFKLVAVSREGTCATTWIVDALEDDWPVALTRERQGCAQTAKACTDDHRRGMVGYLLS